MKRNKGEPIIEQTQAYGWFKCLDAINTFIKAK